MALNRVQILLDPEQQNELKEIARRDGKSMSAVIRDLLALQLTRAKAERDSQRTRYLDNLAMIRQHRESLRATRGGQAIDVDVSVLIDEGREGRDAGSTTR